MTSPRDRTTWSSAPVTIAQCLRRLLVPGRGPTAVRHGYRQRPPRPGGILTGRADTLAYWGVGVRGSAGGRPLNFAGSVFSDGCRRRAADTRDGSVSGGPPAGVGRGREPGTACGPQAAESEVVRWVGSRRAEAWRAQAAGGRGPGRAVRPRVRAPAGRGAARPRSAGRPGCPGSRGDPGGFCPSRASRRPGAGAPVCLAPRAARADRRRAAGGRCGGGGRGAGGVRWHGRGRGLGPSAGPGAARGAQPVRVVGCSRTARSGRVRLARPGAEARRGTTGRLAVCVRERPAVGRGGVCAGDRRGRRALRRPRPGRPVGRGPDRAARDADAACGGPAHGHRRAHTRPGGAHRRLAVSCRPGPDLAG